MITIEQFDNEMKKIVDRQLELKTNYTIEKIVNVSLRNMSKGDFSGITRSAQPFFKSINIEKTLEELMECDFSSALYLYSKRIDSFYKNNAIPTQNFIVNEVKSMDELKQIIDSLYTSFEYEDLITLLKNTYDKNPNIRSFIDEGYGYMVRKGGIPLDDSLNNVVENFVSYIRNYYLMNNKMQYETSVKENSRNIDANFSLLQITPYEKMILLTDLYYGNYNSFLASLQSDIKKQDVIIALLRNAVQTSLVSTNVRETRQTERILYENVQDMENILISVRGITSKLLGKDINSAFLNISEEQLLENLNNLTYEDVKLLAWLYLQTRRNEQTIGVVEKASNASYTLESLNQNQYVNDNKLLKLIESKEFEEILKNQYHI